MRMARTTGASSNSTTAAHCRNWAGHRSSPSFPSGTSAPPIACSSVTAGVVGSAALTAPAADSLTRLLRGGAVVCLWALTAALLTLCVLRTVGFEGRVTVVAAESAIGLVLLPAYAVVVIALVTHHRALMMAAACVVVAHLAWTLPSSIPHRSHP